MLELKGLKKTYKQGRTSINAVDDIDLKIDDGELVAIVGPSGSGKTTLLQLISGLDRPSSGTIHLGDTELTSLSERRLTKVRGESIGFVFQQFNLIPTMTAIENVEAAMAPFGFKSKDRKEKAMSLLSEVGLRDRTGHLPTQLSGGEQQRVAIARALANDPKLVFADEPTGNLDSETGAEIIELLSNLSKDRGQTVIIVTHDTAVAEATSRIVRMNDGKLSS